MQGALRIVVIAAVGAGLVPTVSSAQVVDVSPARVPSVSVPSVALPAPLPQVSTPQLSTPPVIVPGVRVDAPLPSLPQVPSVPEVQAPAPPSLRPAAPVLDGAAGTATPRAPTAPSGTGQAPSKATAAPAGTASATPARPSAAGVAALRERHGVVGTRFRSPRRLVRALAGCVPGLPGRQERLLRLRYGVGGASARPDRAVAGALGLSRGGYATLLGRALRGLVHDARAGGCADGFATGRGARLVAFGDDGGVRAGPATAREAAGASDVAEVAVRGEDASRPSGAADAGGGGPIALGADAPVGTLLSSAVLAAALVLLALLGAARPRRR